MSLKPFSEDITTGDTATETPINEFGITSWILKAGKIVAQKMGKKVVTKETSKILTDAQKITRAEADKAFTRFGTWLKEREFSKRTAGNFMYMYKDATYYYFKNINSKNYLKVNIKPGAFNLAEFNFSGNYHRDIGWY